MARGDKDYGDEGKTSFSKKSKLAPKASPKPMTKPAPKATMSTKSAPMKPKARPLAPAKSARPKTAGDWAKDSAANIKADAKLMKVAAEAKTPKDPSSMSRQELKKAGMRVSPLGKMLDRINAKGQAIADRKAKEKTR